MILILTKFLNCQKLLFSYISVIWLVMYFWYEFVQVYEKYLAIYIYFLIGFSLWITYYRIWNEILILTVDQIASYNKPIKTIYFHIPMYTLLPHWIGTPNIYEYLCTQTHTYIKICLSFTSHLSTACDLLRMPLCEKFWM